MYTPLWKLTVAVHLMICPSCQVRRNHYCLGGPRYAKIELLGNEPQPVPSPNVCPLFASGESPTPWCHQQQAHKRQQAMAKPTAKKPPAKENVAKKDPAANPAFKWQMGGLIAGIIVALVSTTEPGRQVGDQRAYRLLLSPLFCCLICWVHGPLGTTESTRLVS